MDEDLITSVRAQLQKLGVTSTIRHRDARPSLHDDPTPVEIFEVDLRRGPAEGVYTVLCGRSIRPRDTALLHYEGRRDALVWTDHISPQTAGSFRDLGVQFVDSAGNAWLEFGNAIVDVRGQRPAQQSARSTPATSNLFSPNRSRVIFALLAWPHLQDATQQEISTAANVSVGLTNGTLKMLRQEGYDGSGPSRRRLLDRWTDAYPLGLGKSLELGRFHTEAAMPHLHVEVKTPAFLSGESAVDDILKPITLTLYVPGLDKSLIGVNRWRTDRTPNVFVRRQFWNPPVTSAPGPGLQVAPWPLVYADLLTSDDPRVRGAAKEWRARAEPAASI